MPAFWLLSFGFGAYFFVGVGLTVTLISFLTDSGVTRPIAASTLGVFGLGSLGGRFTTGALLDRVHAARVCSVLFFTSAVAIAVMLVFGPQFATPCVFVIGFSMGTEVNATTYCWSRYFGLKALGEIGGLSFMIMMFFGAIGPFAVFSIKEHSGGYGAPLVVLVLAAVLAAFLMMRCGRLPFRDGDPLGEASPGGNKFPEESSV
jgi:cyanate permease